MKTSIMIDIRDLIQEWMDEEPDLETFEDALRLLEQGNHTGKVARLILAGRHLGQAEESILKSDKMLLISGARADLSESVRARRSKVLKREDEEKEYDVPEYVGNSSPDEDEASFVKSDSVESLDLVRRYLFRSIPGQVAERLKILAANEEDVSEDVDRLIGIIRDIENGL